MKKISLIILSALVLLFVVTSHVVTPHAFAFDPQVFTASNVNLGDHSISFTLNPSDVSAFVSTYGTTNMDLRIVSTSNELQGWYNNNLDVTTCLTTGNCSFSGLAENIAPPGSSIQIGFFPDGNHSAVIWSQFIVFSTPTPTPTPTPLIPQVFTASNVNLGDHSISFTFNPSDVSSFVAAHGTTNMDLRIVNSANELQGWYNNNLDVTTCLTTGNCSFSGLAENIAPPGSSIQIGFFPDGHHENVIWSQFIVFSTPTPTPTPTPLIPQVFTASNVNLGDHSISFTFNPSDVSSFVAAHGTTNMDLRIVNSANELQGWYNNNLDVTTCLTTGNCSFSGLAENIAPPGSSIQIGFFPDGHHENVIWSQFIVFSTPTPTPTPTPLIPQVFTASNVNLGDHSISFTFNPSDVSSFVAAHGTTNMDLRIVNSANELQGWYNNNLDVTTCLTTGNCSFSGLAENIAPPGSSIQIGFFPDGDHPDVIWSQVITSFNLNQPPSAGTITVSTNPVQVNSSTTASANFTDADTGDTHTASWNWGDGNTTTGTVTESNGSGSVSDSHTYSTAGVYTITL